MTASTDRLITVAIHTYDHAIELKQILESHDIKVVLQNINLDNPVVSAGMRVRIRECDLPAALRIIENPEIFNTSDTATDTARVKSILVPIDFSPYSEHACRIAFDIASRHKASILLLHTFTDPVYASVLQMSDALTYEVDDIETHKVYVSEADKMMSEFSDKLRNLIKTGELPPAKFTYEIQEGIPEEVINTQAKECTPLLIVMGTRGADKKERELVGSVTAEVLDTCRFPVFTVPEGMSYHNLSEIRRILLFCDVDQEDMLVLERLRTLLATTDTRITLVNIPSKKTAPNMTAPLESLKRYFVEHYPTMIFDTACLAPATVEEDFARIASSQHIDLIAVPNKKKNVFARLFNPGIAHRLLFRTDSPMIVIPV
ncbi:MAG: universal stress protein [Muribaculaceae bacterium]|nr:universal stress protein [Muribaculaceae bacterium]